MSKTTKRIEELTEELKGLRTREILVKDELRQLGVTLAKEEYGIEVGSVVIAQGRYKGPHKILSIDPQSIGGKPWLWATPQKKDGSFGKLRRRLFDWEPVK